MILLGLLGHTVGFVLLWRVVGEWDYVLPSLCGGFAHALLFPCVVSLGAERFPERYRGSGTTLILGFIDVGGALAAQPLGWVIDSYGFTPMYLGTALFCLVTLLGYGWMMFNAPDEDQQRMLSLDASPAAQEATATCPLASQPTGDVEGLTPIGALPR